MNLGSMTVIAGHCGTSSHPQLQLNRAAAAFCGIPQRPRHDRPCDRHPEAAHHFGAGLGTVP